MPAICVVPEISAFYTRASLQAIEEKLMASPVPRSVHIAPSAYFGRSEADSQYATVPARPLKHLFWVAALRCTGAEEAARYETDAFRLRAWPDLTILPHDEHHVQWCGLLARRPVVLSTLASGTGHSVAAATAFLSACDELGILDRGGATDEATADIEAPARGRLQERARVFRSFLNRLGIKRT